MRRGGAGRPPLLRAGVITRLEEEHYPVLPPARVHGLLPTDVAPESVQNIFVFHALSVLGSKAADRSIDKRSC